MVQVETNQQQNKRRRKKKGVQVKNKTQVQSGKSQKQAQQVVVHVTRNYRQSVPKPKALGPPPVPFYGGGFPPPPPPPPPQQYPSFYHVPPQMPLIHNSTRMNQTVDFQTPIHSSVHESFSQSHLQTPRSNGIERTPPPPPRPATPPPQEESPAFFISPVTSAPKKEEQVKNIPRDRNQALINDLKRRVEAPNLLFPNESQQRQPSVLEVRPIKANNGTIQEQMNERKHPEMVAEGVYVYKPKPKAKEEYKQKSTDKFGNLEELRQKRIAMFDKPKVVNTFGNAEEPLPQLDLEWALFRETPQTYAQAVEENLDNAPKNERPRKKPLPLPKYKMTPKGEVISEYSFKRLGSKVDPNEVDLDTPLKQTDLAPVFQQAITTNRSPPPLPPRQKLTPDAIREMLIAEATSEPAPPEPEEKQAEEIIPKKRGRPKKEVPPVISGEEKKQEQEHQQERFTRAREKHKLFAEYETRIDKMKKPELQTEMRNQGLAYSTNENGPKRVTEMRQELKQKYIATHKLFYA